MWKISHKLQVSVMGLLHVSFDKPAAYIVQLSKYV